MTFDEMRAALGLGPEVSDAEVADLYAASLEPAPGELPPTPVLSLESAKQHLKVTDEAEDALITSYIEAVEATVADFLGRPLVDSLAGWPTASAVPANVLHAIRIVLTDIYENRLRPLEDMDKMLRRLVGRYIVVTFS